MVGIKTEMRKACNLDGYKEAFVTKTDDKTPIFDYREARPTLFDAVQVRPPILVYFLLRCCLGFERRTKWMGVGEAARKLAVGVLGFLAPAFHPFNVVPCLAGVFRQAWLDVLVIPNLDAFIERVGGKQIRLRRMTKFLLLCFRDRTHSHGRVGVIILFCFASGISSPANAGRSSSK